MPSWRWSFMPLRYWHGFDSGNIIQVIGPCFNRFLQRKTFSCSFHSSSAEKDTLIWPQFNCMPAEYTFTRNSRETSLYYSCLHPGQTETTRHLHVSGSGRIPDTKTMYPRRRTCNWWKWHFDSFTLRPACFSRCSTALTAWVCSSALL